MSQDDLNETDKSLNALNLQQQLAQNSRLAGKIWRGSKPPRQTPRAVIDSGYATLNQQLHTRGWPLATTTEIGLAQPGIGELRLLIPAMRTLQQQVTTQQKPTALQKPSAQQNIIWIAPPFLPYAPALVKEQIDVSKLTIIQTNNIQDTLWAAEQALLADCCAAVICWTGSYNLSARELRRLQLASEKTHTWNVLLRHHDCLQQPSAAGLRIGLKSNEQGKLDLHIIKQPDGWGGQRCTLSLHPHYEQWQRLAAHLLPHHNRVQMPVIREALDTLNERQKTATVTILTPLSSLKVVH